MTRKVYKPMRSASLWGYPDAEDYLARTIYEQDASPVYTGLLDAAGDKLYLVTELDPIGFVRYKK